MSQTTTSGGKTAPAVPRPGRPRSPQAHRAILDAAAALFIEEGFDAMSVEGVAARAAVGKATIYRRWPSKEDLVIDAIAQVFAAPPRPDTGSVREDLVLMGRELHHLMSSSVTGGVFPPMASEVARNSRLGRLYGERVIGPRRAGLADAIRRGIERGELPTDTDIELAIDMLVGTFLLRRLTHRLKRSDPAMAERAVDLVLVGVRAREDRAR